MYDDSDEAAAIGKAWIEHKERKPMPTERMEEVEVVCRTCHGKSPRVCSGGCFATGVESLPVAPGSLTAARLRLADAWMARDEASAENRAAIESLAPDGDDTEALVRVNAAYQRCRETNAAFQSAVAALRTARGEG